MSNIKRIPLSEKSKIIQFLNENWGSEHPLVNNETFFNYYYLDNDMTNFYAYYEEDKIIAICGYIKSSKEENSDIWISIWCAKKGKNGIGLELMGSMKDLTGANVISCNNIRENTMPFYTFLGYHPDRLNQYYILNDSFQNFKIANIKTHPAPFINKDNSISLKLFSNIDLIKANFINNTDIFPKKDFWYIENRYFKNPYYNYLVYGIYKDSVCVALAVFRLNESEEGFVLRLVDYIGNKADFSLLNGHIQPLLKEFNAEYCDLYSFGVDALSAGFILREVNDENIIPNYLNPLLEKNIDYFFFTSNPENFTMFRADGDQDRKNLVWLILHLDIERTIIKWKF